MTITGSRSPDGSASMILMAEDGIVSSHRAFVLSTMQAAVLCSGPVQPFSATV